MFENKLAEYMEVFRESPDKALELCIAETSRLQEESKANSEVVVTAHGLDAVNLGGLWRIATVIKNGKMCPKDKQTIEQLVIAMAHGKEVGLPPMQAIQDIAVINNRPTIWGDAAIGLVLSSDVCEDIIESFDDHAMVATCTVKRKGHSQYTKTFGIEDAKGAGLWGKSGPWSQYPKRMLQMRARSFTLRDKFADVLKGLRLAEEVMDYDDGPMPSGTPIAVPNGKQAPQNEIEAICQTLGVDEDPTEGTEAATEIKDAEPQVNDGPSDESEPDDFDENEADWSQFKDELAECKTDFEVDDVRHRWTNLPGVKEACDKRRSELTHKAGKRQTAKR